MCERKKKCVCIYVCVCVFERERERGESEKDCGNLASESTIKIGKRYRLRVRERVCVREKD